MRHCRAAATGFLFILLTAGVAVAACGLDHVTVVGDQRDREIACEALKPVAAWFTSIGFNADPSLSIVFEETVYLGGGPDDPHRRAVTGLFLSDEGQIEVTSSSSAHPARDLHWKLPWGDEMARSIVEHELAHAFVYAIDDGAFSPAWREFIAYAVQFEVMDPDLRRRILQGHKGITPLRGRLDICEALYMVDPDLFGLRAYLYVESEGGPSYIAKVLRQEVATGPTRADECPAM